MGGYDVGSLYGALRLDDSQFREALTRAGGASRLLGVELDKLDNNFVSLLNALDKAGYSLDSVTKLFKEGISVGMSQDEVYKELAKTIELLQNRITGLNRAQATELENYRAITEADRLRTQALRDEYAAQQDYLGLTSRLRAEQEEGNKLTLWGLEQERLYRAKATQDAENSRKDYNALLDKLTKEEAAANQAAQAKIAADIEAGEREKQKQYELDLVAFERIEQEKTAEAAKQERLRFEEHRRSMWTASALTTVGAVVGGAGTAAVGGQLFAAKQAADFQDALSKSLSIIGPVSDQLKQGIGDAAIAASKQTGIAAKEIVLNFETIAKGGRPAAEAIKEIGDFAKYSVATQVNLHEATKQVLTVMEALGIDGSQTAHVMDVLTRANQLSRDSVDQLATALEGKGGAALKRFGVTLEQAVAIAATYARAGVDGAKAQTTISQLIQTFTQSVTKYGEAQLKVNGQVTKWRDVVYDADGATRPFYAIVGALSNAFKGFSAEQVNKGLTDLGLSGTRTVNALQPLLGSSGVLSTMTEAFQGNGAMAEAFAQRLQSPIVQLEILKARFVDLAIKVGNPTIAVLTALEKALEPVLQGIEALAKRFMDLDPATQQFIAFTTLAVSGTVAVSGALLVLGAGIYRFSKDLKLLMGADGLARFVTLLSGAAEGALLLAGALTVAYGAYQLFEKATTGTKEERSANSMGYLLGPLVQMKNLVFGGQSTDAAKQGGKKTGEAFVEGAKGPIDQLRILIDEMIKEAKDAPKKLNQNPIVQSPGDPNARRNAFGAFRLRDWDTDIKAAKEQLAQAIKNGWFDPAQVKAAQDQIDEMIRQRNEIGQEVFRPLEKPDNAKSQAWLVQFDTIKKEFKDAHDWLVKYNVALDEGNTNKPENVPVPLTVMDDFDRLSKSTQDWWYKIYLNALKAGDEIRKNIADGQKLGNITSPGPNGPLKTIENYAKQKGIKIIDQDDLNEQAKVAKDVLQQVYDLQEGGAKISTQTIASFQIAYIEDTARAMHQSAQDYARSIGMDYEALRKQVENSVSAGNTAFSRMVKQLGYDLRRIFGDVANGLVSLIPLFDQSTPKIDSLTDSFRGAYEQLSAYSDPKKALTDLIGMIQHAGSIAEANAIAVKYFGTTAGPLLANDLRNGAYSADQIAHAIDQASLSTQQYEDITNKSVSKATQIWQKAVTDIVSVIVTKLIEYGFKKLIDWMFKVGTASSSMADDVIAAVKKIAQWIGLIKTPPPASPIPNPLPGGQVPGVPSAPTQIPTGPSSVPGTDVGGGGGGIGGFLSSNLLGNIFGGISAVSGVIGNFQMHGIGNDTGKIEVTTRGILNEALNLRADEWSRFGQILAKFDMIFNRLGDVWNTIMHLDAVQSGGAGGGRDYTPLLSTIAYNTTLILSKYDEFIVPDLGQLATVGVGGGGPTTITISGPITVQTDNPEDFVRKLKRMRAAQGR